MKVFKVEGGVPLYGEVNISGSKNAALPVIFATLVARGVSKIEGVPEIGDIAVALEIIRSLGAKIKKIGDSLFVDTTNLEYKKIDPGLTGSIRASTYLLGACLGRFHECNLCSFGGCKFSDRPIDMHLMAFKEFGGLTEGEKIKLKSPRVANIKFEKPSVGATINAVILAASIDGVSTISGFAREPHVLSLCDYLRSAGAEIEFSKEKITVRGGRLGGGKTKIIPDMIEAGTYLCAAATAGGKVTVRGVDPSHLRAFLETLENIGAKISAQGDAITVEQPRSPQYASVCAEAYPGFPTDLQPIIAPVLAASGGGRIEDRVWLGRYGYLDVLKSFGLKYKLSSVGAEIYPSDFSPARVCAPDLRGGAAALICALRAKGESRVSSAEYILRGYERPEEKLTSLGAKIRICDE